MTDKGTSALSLLIAGLGLVLVILGLGIVGLDAAKAVDSGEWRSDSLLDLLTSPRMQWILPTDLVGWLEHPRSLKTIHPPVVFLLDAVAQWFVYLGLGGFIVWKALT